MHHKELSIKTPKLLSVYHAKVANPEVLNNWFELYKEVFGREQHSRAPCIFGMLMSVDAQILPSCAKS